LTEESSVVPSDEVLDDVVGEVIIGMIPVINWFRSWWCQWLMTGS
jgi:hypothetical protein